MEPRPSSRVAVVVVNWNGGDVLTRCLDALAGQTLAPARIIVVDNASTDGSVDRLEERHRRVEVIRLAGNVGFAAGNNLAVRTADDCDWVALLKPDAFPEPGWLEALLQARADEPDFDFFASRLLQAEAPDTRRRRRLSARERPRLPPRPRRVGGGHRPRARGNLLRLRRRRASTAATRSSRSAASTSSSSATSRTPTWRSACASRATGASTSRTRSSTTSARR